MGRTLDFHNFSIRGDPQWYGASKWTRWGPLVVIWIFVFSTLETVMGAIWIVQLGGDMTIPKILQTLILPGLSFFNAVPSLHLHMLVRRNPPKLAIWFSSSLALLYLVSSILFLASCSAANDSSIPLGLRQTECPKGRNGGLKNGPSPALWAIFVAFSLVSMLLYLTHAGMAWVVKMVVDGEEEEKRRRRAERGGDEGAELEVVVDPEEAALARERWRALGRYEL